MEARTSANGPNCPICSQKTSLVGRKFGPFDGQEYTYWHCPACRFSFVGNPRTDYADLYSEQYYQGLGADPLIDYVYELSHSERTIRHYEWQGVSAIFQRLVPQGGRWLDFGCGVGGMVAFARRLGLDAVGFEYGWGAQAGRLQGLPILGPEELKAHEGAFDFVSAIEVLEHTPDPLTVLGTIRSLLKPGGIFFLTTGNARPWRGRLLQWAYTRCPEVHISFFEPETLVAAFQKTGFHASYALPPETFRKIIQYKVLKTLRFKNRHALLEVLPWRWIGAFVDARYQVSKLPIGIAII